MFLANVVVNPASEGCACVWRRYESGEPCHRRQIRLDNVDAIPIRVLEVEEEKCLVFLDWSADDESTLPACEEGIVGDRCSAQARIGGNIVVAVVKIGVAMEVV